MTDKTVYVATIQENPENLRKKTHDLLTQYFYGQIPECLLIHLIAVTSDFRLPDDWTYNDFKETLEK